MDKMNALKHRFSNWVTRTLKVRYELYSGFRVGVAMWEARAISREEVMALGGVTQKFLKILHEAPY